MKFKEKEKLLFLKENKQLHFTFIILILVFLPFSGNCQKFNFKFNNTPISIALLEVSAKTNIRIAFDADELEKIKLSKNISEKTIDEVILSLLENTPYTSEYKHKTYLIVRKKANKSKNTPNKIVSGIVFDQVTGERLPYATLYVLNKNMATSTNVNGNFSLTFSNCSTAYIQIRYLGYFILDTVIDVNSQIQFLSMGLSQKTQTIKEVEVKGNKIDMIDVNNDAGHFSFNPMRFIDLPNYGETDIFRSLQLLPGISTMENSSHLNIRGSSADQNLVLLDGFTLYNLDHFFGVFSAINPNIVKNIQAYLGGFDSRYGERISGIIDITGKSGNNQKASFYGGLNLISANLTAEIPLNKKLTILAAGRRAYSDLFSSWLADDILADKVNLTRPFQSNQNIIKPKFYFSDYNIKTTYSPNPKENISFSIYGSKDDLNSSTIYNDYPLDIKSEENNQWGNYGFGISWKKQVNANYFTDMQLGHSGYFNNYYDNTNFPDNKDLSMYPIFTKGNVVNEENKLTDYFLSIKNKYNFNHKNQIAFGASVKFNKFTYYKDATTNFIYDDIESSALLYNLYFQDKINVTKNLSIKTGIRLNFYDGSGKLYLEPRFSMSYKIGNKLILKLACGKYYQYLNKMASEQNFGYSRDFWVLSDGKKHPVLSSNHFILGASYETKYLFFNIEAYYKSMKGIQEYLFYTNPEDRIFNEPAPQIKDKDLSKFISGTGKALGIDFLAKYENTNITSWLSYSLSKSRRNFDEINLGENIPAKYDQTHEIKWTNIFSYKKWNFSTLTLFTTGHPYIETTSKDEDFNTIRTYNRMPNYFRIDFSMNYNFHFKNINIKPGLSILNMMNSENYLDVYVRNFGFENNLFQETSLIKAQELTLNFFINFRF